MKTNNKQPLVSICIPTYNGAKYIEETLNSALKQTYTNIEIVITDDSSSDDTVAICKRYAEQDSRIKVFENTSNLGLVGNWCESVEKASSEWIKFLFQDDLITPDCVELMITAALQHEVDFVISNREYFFEPGFSKKIKRFYTEKLPKPDHIFESDRVYTPQETGKLMAPFVFNNCIGEPPTFLFKKSQHSRDDYPDTYFQLIDYVFILGKLLNHNFVFINKDLLRFRVHNSSETMKNTTIDTTDTKSFYKYLYIQFYEKIQLCYDLQHNPLYAEIKKHISKRKFNIIKHWLVIISYYRHGIDSVLPFYKQSALSDFIVDDFAKSYSYAKYKTFRMFTKSTRKKYKV